MPPAARTAKAVRQKAEAKGRGKGQRYRLGTEKVLLIDVASLVSMTHVYEIINPAQSNMANSRSTMIFPTHQ